MQRYFCVIDAQRNKILCADGDSEEIDFDDPELELILEQCHDCLHGSLVPEGEKEEDDVTVEPNSTSTQFMRE